MPGEPASVAIVLPPREGFGPGRTGAVGMIAHRFAAASGPFAATVIGGPQSGPLFPNVVFRSARPAFWLPLDANRRYAAGVARLLRHDRPALIEVHNRAEIALFLAARFPAAPVALVLHNDPQAMRPLAGAGARAAALRRLDAVVAVSGFVAERMAAGISAPARLPVVLPNPIELAALPARLPPDARAPEILFVGRTVPDKAPDVFVAACAAALPGLPGWQAAVLGADRFGADSPETRFVAALRPAAAAAAVAMSGYQPHDAVLAAMARAAIAVVPSRWQEPFGLTALEAMASGAALVCSRRGGLPEVAGEAALYADPDRPETFAAAIAALATDPDRRRRLAEAGLARARRFDLPTVAARLNAIRAGLLARRPPRQDGRGAPRPRQPAPGPPEDADDDETS